MNETVVIFSLRDQDGYYMPALAVRGTSQSDPAVLLEYAAWLAEHANDSYWDLDFAPVVRVLELKGKAEK